MMESKRAIAIPATPLPSIPLVSALATPAPATAATAAVPPKEDNDSSSSSTTASEVAKNIRVYVRVRPANSREMANGYHSCVTVNQGLYYLGFALFSFIAN
jgi:hypothetical protein